MRNGTAAPALRTLALVAGALLSSLPAVAGTHKIALLFANHEGGDDLPTLRYVERDAQRLRDVLVDMGEFDPDQVTLLVDKDAEEVVAELEQVEREVKNLKARGHDVVLLVYYSGHAANGVLRLGDTKLEMRRLKNTISASAADVRLAFLDSCGAGAITREKGGRSAPPFVVSIEDAVRAKGQVIITSSSADEASQESDDIQGSFFTHYLTTGMRGAGDENGDGRVTLDEAYSYAYSRTVATTANTRSGVQHPTYQYDLRGAGDVTLTRPGGADVILTFPAEAEGQYFVVDLDRQVFVAEIEKRPGEASKISLPVGEYAVKKRLDTHLMMQRVEARSKGSFVVDEAAMEKVSFEDDYAKGTPILQGDLDDGLGFSLSLGTGGQFFLIDGSGGYYPASPLITLEMRLTNVFTEHLMLSGDVSFTSRPHTYTADGQSLQIAYSQVQLGASVLAAWEWELFTLGGWEPGKVQIAGGPRMGAMLVTGIYDDPVGNFHFATNLTPGLVALAGYSPVDWFHLEAMARVSATATSSLHPLLYGEAILSAWVDF